MKTGKDEEKIMGPMFPRLHVNDADKGGPRAPPRNKMALYEQLSIPSQKYGSGVVPLNPKTTTNMVPSASSSQGSGVERNLVFPRHLPPPTATHWSEKFHARHSDIRNGNALGAQLEHRKKVGDEDDFMVPVFVQAREGESHDKTQNTIDRESRSSTSSACSGQAVERQNISKKDSKQDNLVAVNFKQEARSDRKENMTGGGESGSAIISATDQSNREKIDRHMKEAKTLSNQAHKESAVSDLSRSDDGKTCSNQQSRAGVQIQSSRQDDDRVESTRDIEGASASHPRSESCCGEDHGVPSEAENVSKPKSNSNRMCISLQLENADKGDDLSEASIVDSIYDLDISPDDIVGFIGQKHFWKARRAIVNQQRVFAMQVFELHRLIKVQRLIAGSPHLLLEHGAFLAKSSLKGSPAKKLVPESVVKPLPCVATNCKGGNSEKSNEKMEHSAKNAVGKTSLSSVKTCSQSLNYPPHAGNPQPVVARPDNKMGPWCFHQSPGPQWLVPVMSPSEGLVYKPYMGPGFPGAVYGGRGPFGSTPMTGNIPNSDFGISSSHHQGIGVFPRTSPVGHAYIPPYGMPIINPSMSVSTVEQVCQFGGAGMVPGGMVNSNTEQQSSCNVPAHENGSVSQPEKFQASKGSELQGSTASSPGDRAKSAEIGHDPNARDPLLLFPMAPVVSEEPSHSHETAGPQPTRAIKVVPHNPWSATESAARIFRFIQEERKQYNPI